jgi:hypothetical protein
LQKQFALFSSIGVANAKKKKKKKKKKSAKNNTKGEFFCTFSIIWTLLRNLANDSFVGGAFLPNNFIFSNSNSQNNPATKKSTFPFRVCTIHCEILLLLLCILMN